jgi:Pyruvate/2-oxoacid:ferredoxin oxidoreductase delta subunit
MKLLLLATIIALSGCSSTIPKEVFGIKGPAYGYKDYDPCIRCGEGWTFMPNKAISSNDIKVYN